MARGVWDLEEITEPQAVIETVADAYGTAVEQEEKRSNVSYEYDAWLAPIRDLYSLTDHTPVIATIDEYPVPQVLGDNGKDIHDLGGDSSPTTFTPDDVAGNEDGNLQRK